MANGASTEGASALPEEDSTGVRCLLKLLKVSIGFVLVYNLPN